MSSKEKVDIKVVFLGDSGVGKSCLLVRFLDNSFGDTTATIVLAPVISKNNDTAGQERYDSLSSFYCRGATCAVIAFDLTNKDSFENLHKWVSKLFGSNPDPNCFIILVGTKIDMIENGTHNRAVFESDIRGFVERNNVVEYFETSALTGKNVAKIFDKIVEKYAQLNPKQNGGQNSTSSPSSNQRVDLTHSSTPTGAKKSCC